MSKALRFPPGLDATGFLRTHWQRRPLLMRGALLGFESPLGGDALAGLACDPDVESRLVLERDGEHPWEVRHGPFEEADFADLPETRWTLLVQDVDKLEAVTAGLLDLFRFIPDWRVDDVMISYAVDGGSVGPHVDEYDVFLVQAEGKRRWRLDPRPDPDLSCIPDLDLRILQRFEPREDHLLEPGDVLYLPPGVPHWGSAEGHCITCSVGFRAPAWRELGSAWCEFVAERNLPNGRFRDLALDPQADSGEILPAVFEQIRHVLYGTLRNLSEEILREWFGRFVTEQKENLQVFPADEPLNVADLRARIERGKTLERSGFSRMAFSRGTESGDALLYVNGEAYPVPSAHRGFLALLTQERTLSRESLADWLAHPDCVGLLSRLYNEGHYEVCS
jgi:50S ribosomal protein L16 3-hydroxylase